MILPNHKSGTIKFDGDPMKRTIAPLTGEDTTNFINMNLMSTLRQGKFNANKGREDGRGSSSFQLLGQLGGDERLLDGREET